MVDGGGSLRVALMGDQIGAGAVKNGWKVGLFRRFSSTSVAQYVSFFFFVCGCSFFSFIFHFFIFSFWSCSSLLAVFCLVSFNLFFSIVFVCIYVVLSYVLCCVVFCCVLCKCFFQGVCFLFFFFACPVV